MCGIGCRYHECCSSSLGKLNTVVKAEQTGTNDSIFVCLFAVCLDKGSKPEATVFEFGTIAQDVPFM